jgi:hypothetical protein
VNDAGDLRAVERAARVQREQHRRRRLLLLAHEAVLGRQGEVHAGVLHGRQGLDRACELALEPALEVQPLLELRGAEALGLHQLEADGAALSAALRGQFQPGVVDQAAGHQDRAAAFGEPVRHVHLRQRGHHGAAVPVRQVGEQHLVVRRARPVDRSDDDPREREDACQEHEDLLDRQSSQATESGLVIGRVGQCGFHLAVLQRVSEPFC